MEILVADTSVIVDLDHGALMAPCLAHNWRMCVPDLLHAIEIKTQARLHAVTQGICVETLTAAETGMVQPVRAANGALSVSDAAAFVLAKSRGWMLLTGDKPLRTFADANGVCVHGTLWVLDRLFDDGVLGPALLRAALSTIAALPTCRLPHGEIASRLAQWA